MDNLNWTLIETVINADTMNNYKLQIKHHRESGWRVPWHCFVIGR